MDLRVKVFGGIGGKKGKIQAALGRSRANAPGDRRAQFVQCTLVDIYTFNAIKSSRQDIAADYFLFGFVVNLIHLSLPAICVALIILSVRVAPL